MAIPCLVSTTGPAGTEPGLQTAWHLLRAALPHSRHAGFCGHARRYDLCEAGRNLSRLAFTVEQIAGYVAGGPEEKTMNMIYRALKQRRTAESLADFIQHGARVQFAREVTTPPERFPERRLGCE